MKFSKDSKGISISSDFDSKNVEKVIKEYEMKQNIKNSFDNNKKDILEIDISKLNDKQKKYVMQKYSEIVLFITTGKKKRGFYFYFTWVFIILIILVAISGNNTK
ncbi:hypothetical protein AVBRAN9333_08635 [Campylobacter sp. RM9333]|uniref:hypothetical protein n=2 Tax=unclassified Campylobacter TaxID=2593542 RepID=UPI001DA423E1|nr:hypothetical protein [Campylobacter sp. RM9333]